jgi:hypothetical protein
MNVVIVEEYNVGLIAVHLEKQLPVLREMNGETAFIFKLMKRSYFPSDDRLKQVNTVFFSAIEFPRKTETTEIRLKACFDEKWTG